MALDGVADIAQRRARAHRFDAAHQRFVGHVHQPARLHPGAADREHAAGVAVPAVEDHRDVDVHDVALGEHLVARDAVADHVVDRGADRFREAAVVQRRRHRAALDDEVVAERVQRAGGHPGDDMRGHEVEHLGREPSGAAHRGERIRAVDRHVRRRVARRSRSCASGRSCARLYGPRQRPVQPAVPSPGRHWFGPKAPPRMPAACATRESPWPNRESSPPASW